MRQLVRKVDKLANVIPLASQVLIDYEYWLKRNYKVTGAYLVNAKSFLKTYRQGGDVRSQLNDYINQRGPSLRSILRRFETFIAGRGYVQLINDLHEPKLPLSNIYVKLFLALHQDRLRSKGSLTTYATVLNGYFESIKDDIKRINKRTAGKYVLSPALSDYTKRLYKTVLKAFCDWALTYQSLDPGDLSRDQKHVRIALRKISVQSLREISSMRVVLPRSITAIYHKDSLNEKQRQRLLQVAKSKRDRAIIALMAWNGLRTIEVLRLTVSDIRILQGKIRLWGKGKGEKSKDTIKLSSVAKRELISYLKKDKKKKGKVFENLSRQELDTLLKFYFRKLRLKGKYSPHSLRHTSGQLMYEKNIPLEFIQKTLRHADLRTTMIYAQKAIEKTYFKRLRRF